MIILNSKPEAPALDLFRYRGAWAGKGGDLVMSGQEGVALFLES